MWVAARTEMIAHGPERSVQFAVLMVLDGGNESRIRRWKIHGAAREVARRSDSRETLGTGNKWEPVHENQETETRVSYHR